MIYGWGLSGYLPYDGFEWLKNLDGFDAMSISKKNPIWCFLEVDLEYSDETHLLTNSYLLVSEKLPILYDMFSEKIVKKLQANV